MCSIAFFSALVFVVLRTIAFKNPLVADVYAEKVFQPLATIWAWPVKHLPFSLTEVCVVLGSMALVALLIRGIVRLVIYSSWRWRRLLKSALVILTVALFSLTLFVAFHGINYARSPLAQTLGLTIKKRPVEELERVTALFARAASDARKGLPEDEQGVLSIDNLNEILKTSNVGWDQAAKTMPALKSSIQTTPKGVILSHYWSYTHIVGLYMPLFLEVNINIDQPDFAILSTAAHELAHARGFAREDDANLASYISCFYHPDPIWRYSGLVSAWKHLSNRLYSEDYDRWVETNAEISTAVSRDLNAERTYWKAFETPIATISTTINDAYLKANKVEEGVKSYGQVVDILLAYMDFVGNSFPTQD